VIRVFGALLTMLVLASVCGCGTEEAESLQSRAGADEAVVAEPEGAADDRASVVTVGPFRPPSPHRTNPFRLGSQGSEEVDGLPVLRGFVAVDGKAVVLSAGGQVRILEPGATFNGTTVVAIKPSEAELETDGQRWTASILNMHQEKQAPRRVTWQEDAPNTEVETDLPSFLEGLL